MASPPTVRGAANIDNLSRQTKDHFRRAKPAVSPDIFGRLLGIAWKGQGFPVVAFRHGVSQDLVEHRFMATDGAHIEATGRAPMVFSARAMFRNGVEPAASETDWVRPLYPDGWRAFLKLADDRATGKLKHPELGLITCKLRSFETEWNAGVRDGVDVELQWIETTDNPTELNGLLSKPSPIGLAATAAATLDGFQYQLATQQIAATLYPTDTGDGLTFTQFVQKIQAAIDRGIVLERQLVGSVASVIAKVTRIVDAVDTLLNPSLWPLRSAAIAFIMSMRDVQKTLNLGGAQHSYWMTPGDMTVTRVALALSQSPRTLISLNPSLVGLAVVPARTLITYVPAG